MCRLDQSGWSFASALALVTRPDVAYLHSMRAFSALFSFSPLFFSSFHLQGSHAEQYRMYFFLLNIHSSFFFISCTHTLLESGKRI